MGYGSLLTGRQEELTHCELVTVVADLEVGAKTVTLGLHVLEVYRLWGLLHHVQLDVFDLVGFEVLFNH